MTANEEILDILLSKNQLLPALRFVRGLGAAALEHMASKRFLEAAWASRDRMLFFTGNAPCACVRIYIIYIYIYCSRPFAMCVCVCVCVCVGAYACWSVFTQLGPYQNFEVAFASILTSHFPWSLSARAVFKFLEQRNISIWKRPDFPQGLWNMSFSAV